MNNKLISNFTRNIGIIIEISKLSGHKAALWWRIDHMCIYIMLMIMWDVLHIFNYIVKIHFFIGLQRKSEFVIGALQIIRLHAQK